MYWCVLLVVCFGYFLLMEKIKISYKKSSIVLGFEVIRVVVLCIGMKDFKEFVNEFFDVLVCW